MDRIAIQKTEWDCPNQVKIRNPVYVDATMLISIAILGG